MSDEVEDYSHQIAEMIGIKKDNFIEAGVRTLGFVDLLRDDYVEKDRSRGIFFTQDWCLRKFCPLLLQFVVSLNPSKQN
jgi:hypothetical protein